MLSPCLVSSSRKDATWILDIFPIGECKAEDRTSFTLCFFRYKNEIITYKNFNHIINSYVETLNALNVNIKRVLIDIDNPVFMLGALCACNRTQKIPAIMPLVKYRIPNINYMKLSKSEFLLNNSCIIQVINLDIDSISYNPKDVQCVIFSSGTEGKPKAIELTYQNIYLSLIHISEPTRPY